MGGKQSMLAKPHPDNNLRSLKKSDIQRISPIFISEKENDRFVIRFPPISMLGGKDSNKSIVSNQSSMYLKLQNSNYDVTASSSSSSLPPSEETNNSNIRKTCPSPGSSEDEDDSVLNVWYQPESTKPSTTLSEDHADCGSLIQAFWTASSWWDDDATTAASTWRPFMKQERKMELAFKSLPTA